MTSISNNIKGLAYPEEIALSINNICASPALCALIDQVGQIQVEIADCKGHAATWNWGKKVITLDPSLNKTEVDFTASLVFELFNAFQTPALKKAVDISTNVEELVYSIEKIEHASALITNAVMKQVFGEDIEHDFSHVYSDFKVHYAFCQASGHSEWVANAYFPGQEFRGTLAVPLSELDQEARGLIRRLILMKESGSETMIKGEKTRFEHLLYALKIKSPSNNTYKKVLECIEGLFFENPTNCTSKFGSFSKSAPEIESYRSSLVSKR